MPTKAQKKDQKKKQRAKEVKTKLRVEREKSREPERERREGLRQLKRFRKLAREMDHFNDHIEPEELIGLPEDSVRQLEKNIEILKALEQEWNTEEQNRRKINESLETEGALTFEEKLNILHNRLAKSQAMADVLDASEFTIDADELSAAKDTAEVEVLKANIQEVPE